VTRIAIIYYSATGNVHALARTVADGVFVAITRCAAVFELLPRGRQAGRVPREGRVCEAPAQALCTPRFPPACGADGSFTADSPFAGGRKTRKDVEMTQTLIHASTPFATTIAAALLMVRIATIKGQVESKYRARWCAACQRCVTGPGCVCSNGR